MAIGCTRVVVLHVGKKDTVCLYNRDARTLHLLLNRLCSSPLPSWADPFGYSPTQAYINKRSGLKYMLIQRAHYEIKKILSWHKNLEFWWRQVWFGCSIFLFLLLLLSSDPHTPNFALE